jgi:hypothetical protein
MKRIRLKNARGSKTGLVYWVCAPVGVLRCGADGGAHTGQAVDGPSAVSWKRGLSKTVCISSFCHCEPSLAIQKTSINQRLIDRHALLRRGASRSYRPLLAMAGFCRLSLRGDCLSVGL